MEQYHKLLRDITSNGHWKESGRPGMPRTQSVFGRQLRFNLQEGFPLLTTKKMYTRGIFGELLWFLRGDTNIKYLVDNNINIWNGDAYRHYLKMYDITINEAIKNGVPLDSSPLNKDQFIDVVKNPEKYRGLTNVDFNPDYKVGDLGPVYGKQWRRWQQWISIPEVHQMARGSVWRDQFGVALQTLLKNPDSRRIIVSAWNPADLDDMALPPCHIFFQFYTRELSVFERAELVKKMDLTKDFVIDSDHEDDAIAELDKLCIPKREISLQMYQRSVDTFLGLPFNIASYAAIVELVAKWTNMVPGEMIMNLGDTHIYENHMDQVNEILSRDPHKYSLPNLEIENVSQLSAGDELDLALDKIAPIDFKIIGYESYPKIKAELSVGV